MQPTGDIHFEKFTALIYRNFGIYLSEAKKDMLYSKLNKLMQRNKISSYEDYYHLLAHDANGRYMVELADEITVNKTSFFRENSHFDYIRNNINSIISKNPKIIKSGEIRVWSSACSTGEEPYTVGMVLKECLPQGINIRILATDISKKVLLTAQRGVYPFSAKNDVEHYYLKKYFIESSRGYEVSETVKSMVTFRQFNLMHSFPFKRPFDLIFCRNTMIYFDSAVRQTLLDKFYRALPPGGLLFIGHSESISCLKHNFKYVQPTIYLKI